jgi:hypothetical protein
LAHDGRKIPSSSPEARHQPHRRRERRSDSMAWRSAGIREDILCL